jgi:maleate cis-trans isomerase
MPVEYGPDGLIGVLTPQANTTVEPEFWTLLPPGFSLINARLTSGKATMEDRLIDYFAQLEASLRQFANAPVDVFAVACTGASYLVGAGAERELVDRATAAAGRPVLTAGHAVVRALRALGAQRIGLLTPYPASLSGKSTAYWSEQGFDVRHVVDVAQRSGAFHPIYAMPGSDALAALAQFDNIDVDAVLMLGTGMPTLGAIAAATNTRRPVLSCMLALGWASIAAVTKPASDRDDLLHFLEHGAWRQALRQRTPQGRTRKPAAAGARS